VITCPLLQDMILPSIHCKIPIILMIHWYKKLIKHRRENGDHKMAEVMGMWTMNFLSEKPKED
jgi:hypothetical protein